jgi:hypothetical protein
MILLANNNASSTLAGPISPSATALNVQSGAGALFPTPGANEYFTLTLNDAATGLRYEICWCTNVTGDTLTVIRAQEGTAAQSWLANDLTSNFWTAGSMAAMAQQGQLQAFTANQSADTGSVNNLVGTLSPVPASLSAISGAPIIITNVRATNTGRAYLNLNGLGSLEILNADGTSMSPGQLVVGSNIMVNWNSISGDFSLISATTASQPPMPYVNSTVGAFSGVPVPGGMTRAKVTLIGGGGAGGGCDGTHNAGGGGGGGICIAYIGVVQFQTLAGSVGAGGAGASGVTGGNGGATTLQVNGTGTVYTAGGGFGGTGASTAPGGGGGGTATGGTLNFSGGYGGDGDATSINAPAGNGAPGYLGMGGGKGSESASSNGLAPGAGGGGSYISTTAGGSGSGGLVIVEWSP